MKTCLATILLIVAPEFAGLKVAEAVQSPVRDRLQHVVESSRSLLAKAGPLDKGGPALPELQATFKEDGAAVPQGRFPKLGDARTYWKLRPWVKAATDTSFTARGTAVVEPEWPHVEDAPSLRLLLSDKDAAIRSLAVEALASLDLPEDVDRFRSLISDREVGAPALANVFTMSSQGIAAPRSDDSPWPFVIWSERTVGDYASIAIRMMTGFDGDRLNPSRISFDDWWKRNNLGLESIWYWQERLLREKRSTHAIDAIPGENVGQHQERLNKANTTYHAALQDRTLKDFKTLSADAQLKIFLVVSEPGFGDVPPIGPVNELFPEEFTPPLPRNRFLELLDPGNFWKDAADIPMADMTALARLARLAPSVLPESDWSAVRSALERRASGRRWMPVFFSRLLPPATATNMDDSQTREGYLRTTLKNSSEGYTRENIAAEIVRSNLDAQWRWLSAVFYAESSKSGGMRLGVLKALGEAPHTKAKLTALVELINDPRNDTILTQRNATMGMDGYRQQMMWSMNAISGTDYITRSLFERLGFGTEEQSAQALAELRHLATTLLANYDGR